MRIHQNNQQSLTPLPETAPQQLATAVSRTVDLLNDNPAHAEVIRPQLNRLYDRLIDRLTGRTIAIADRATLLNALYTIIYDPVDFSGRSPQRITLFHTLLRRFIDAPEAATLHPREIIRARLRLYIVMTPDERRQLLSDITTLFTRWADEYATTRWANVTPAERHLRLLTHRDIQGYYSLPQFDTMFEAAKRITLAK